jgi:hypothetical protein
VTEHGGESTTAHGDIDPDGPAEGPPLTDTSELLWRQVHPSWMQQGVPTSQAWYPTPKDRKRLSTARSSMIDAEAAYERHLAEERKTEGTWAVTVAEADEAATSAHHDGGSNGLPDDHASLYFGGKNRNAMERASKFLRAAANTRGRQHP